MYKVGDIYVEKCKKFFGFDKSGNVVTADHNIKWKIIQIDESGMLCKHGDNYKVFEIEI